MTTLPLKILFADDSEETISYLKWRAADEGWDATFVNTARGIIKAVNDHCSEGQRCFDIIVADVNYFDDEHNKPHLTGMTAAREIRKNYPDIPILFISAWVSVLVRQEARKLGGKVMAKPFDWEELVEKIKYLVEWNSRVAPKKYKGRDKRHNSLNLTDNARRNTDAKAVEVSPVLEKAIAEMRATAKGRNYE